MLLYKTEHCILSLTCNIHSDTYILHGCFHSQTLTKIIIFVRHISVHSLIFTINWHYFVLILKLIIEE